MEIRIEQGAVAAMETDALVAPVCEKEGRSESDVLQALNESTGRWLDEVEQTGEFSGKSGEIVWLHRPGGLKTRRLVLAGAGKAAKFNGAEMRKLAGAVVRKLKSTGASSVTMLAATAGEAAAAVEGAILGDYEPDQHKSDKSESKHLAAFAVATSADAAEAVRRAQVIAESQNFTRDLVNEPANRLTPTLLADRASAMAAAQGLECEVLDRDRMRQLGMGSLLGVAQGSAEPPALIILRYRPSETAGGDHLGIVGKGVTFDTGGISIKPSDGMEKMKYDMAGGAAAIGAMRAIAQLRPPIPVTAFIPAVENMPGSRAQRPGDVVTSLAGKTVEVLNTDAEGRLILIDAITYARRLGCTHLVDAATLTGAIVVALGYVNVGAFSNDDPLLSRVLAAARAEGEKMWPMPLDEEYREQLKSAFADIQNIGTRYGGAVTAAMFLKEFADETPWAHLDIAGTDWLGEAKPHLAKGPSGVSVRTLIRLALDW
jgi:leucyl aminopeptidase